jgi:hypothetical protein
MPTLGQRCVDWSLAKLGLKESPVGSNDGPEIRQWRKHCVRGNKPLGLGPVEWCSILVSEAMRVSLEEGEKPPHGFRAGAIELVEDAKDIRRIGGYSSKWIRSEDVFKGAFVPNPGDLAIYDRSQPGKPNTTWWRHVNRVIAYDAATGTFSAIGGNEGVGEVRKSEHSIHEPRLLGFVAYPQ